MKYSSLILIVLVMTVITAMANNSFDDNYKGIASLQVPEYVKVVDYTGRGLVVINRNDLQPDIQKPIVLIIADQLNLIDATFDYCAGQAPRQIVLVAEEIQVSGTTEFNLGGDYSAFVPPNEPRCNSPYFPAPGSTSPQVKLGALLPPVLSIVTRNLVVKEDGYICANCPPVEYENWNINIGFYGGNHFFPSSVESASEASISIAAEKIDMTSKTDKILETINAHIKLDPSWRNKPKSNQEMKEKFTAWFASVFYNDWDKTVDFLNSLSWAKPFFDELQSRRENSPITESDLDLFRRFLKAGYKNIIDNKELFPLTGLTRPTKVISLISGKTIDLIFDFRSVQESGGNLVLSRKLEESGRNDPNALRALSLWAVVRYYRLLNRIKEAERSENHADVLRLLRDFTTLQTYEIRPEHQRFYSKAVGKITSIRERYRNQLWRRSIQADLPGLPPRAVDIFSESTSLETYIAPTHALITETTVGERTVLGTLNYRTDSSTSPEIELIFTAELGVDSLLEEAVKRKLNTQEHYSGQFSNWTLEDKPIVVDGIKSSDVEFTGNLMTVKLRLDAITGKNALFRLNSNAGIPLTLSYKYRNNDSQTGNFVIPLSLALRKRSPIEVTSEGLKNTAKLSVTVSYVKLANGSIKTLLPEITIQPGQTRALSQVEAGQMQTLTIPPTAISFASEPHALNEFYNSQGINLIERITIRNNVPVNRSSREGSLQRLELRVSYITEDGQEREPKDVVLTPSGPAGSQITLPFFRIQGASRIVITGRAIYDNGADNIPRREFPVGDITIESETITPQ